MEERIKLAQELIQFALDSDVDYIYILEDLQKILDGKMKSFDKKSYWN